MSIEEIRYLNRKMIMDILPVSRTTLVKLEKSNEYPRPVYLTGSMSKPFWRQMDIKDYLDALHTKSIILEI
tara:strand:- start:1613 stop:1825 length:213 start_codon:yes stop_codon:yes gene_type:complete